MKLNILVITMILTMCLALCACGGGTAATITDNEGNVVQMTAKELKNIYKENEAKFNDLYQGADIELTDTVESVSTDTVELKGGWEVQLSTSKHGDILKSLSKGDSVYVKSTIYTAFTAVEIKGLVRSVGWNDPSLKHTVFRKSEDQLEYKNNFDASYDALSDDEKDFFDTFAEKLKGHVQNDGIGEYTELLAWKDKNYTYFYLENKGPDSTWMRVSKDGSAVYAPSPDILQISKNASPVLDDYSNVMELVNLYLDL